MSNFLIIPKLSHLEQSLALAREYGFGFEYNDFFLPTVLDDPAELKKIAAEYALHDLPKRCTAHGDFFDVIPFSEDKYIREIAEKRIRESISAARLFGAEAVVFHTNYSPEFLSEYYVNNWYEKNEKLWRRILHEYPDMKVYVENMCDHSPEMLAELAERLSDCENFGVCFDYAHACVFGKGTDICEWSEKLAPYAKHMHINDNDLTNDMHLAVGDGKIDWNRFKEIYEKYFSECTVLIETSDIENQRKSAEYLQKIGVL